MAEHSSHEASVIDVELTRAEAAGLVAAIDALNDRVMGDAAMMAALDLTVETLELADLAGAKVLMRL
jgi:hypothetical protein